MDCVLRFSLVASDYCVVIDDDNRVAYAYLKRNSCIVGDVWLYNHCKAPLLPEWIKRDKIPFANACEYSREEAESLMPEDPADFSVEWCSCNGIPTSVKIYIRKNVCAKLEVGSKPGWCVNAKKDGPLAKVMPTF